MTDNDASKIDQLLDLLLDSLQERQAARGIELPVTQTAPPQESAAEDVPESIPPAARIEQAVSQPPQAQESAVEDVPESIPGDLPAAGQDESEDMDQVADLEVDDGADESLVAVLDGPEKLPSIQLGRMLGRLALALLVLTVLINIPFNRYGTNLARAMPDAKSLVIRDGLVLKGEGDEIYVLEDDHKRWISSLDAFEYYGFRWEQVNQVDDDFLDQFPTGPALSILYKCDDSPHVYAIENGVKRWIKDIPTFEAQGYVWDDVQFVSCQTIEDIPSGPPIPPDEGEPPPP
jgi:hypothetical protein